MRTLPTLALALCVALGATLFAASQASQQPSPTAAHMEDHFGKVEQVQEAVIRGDLESAKQPAQWIAEHQSMQGLPAKTETQVAAMKLAAQRVIEAKDIRMATNAVATMASTCGTCHRSSGVTPKMPAPAMPPETGDLAGHMLAHQHAVDYMYQGLVTPSEDLWRKGAELLKVAPMAKDKFPEDPKLTEDIKAYEAKIHSFAEMARKASDPKTRVNLYGELLAGCAECHSLHGRAWGPGLPK